MAPNIPKAPKGRRQLSTRNRIASTEQIALVIFNSVLLEQAIGSSLKETRAWSSLHLDIAPNNAKHWKSEMHWRRMERGASFAPLGLWGVLGPSYLGLAKSASPRLHA